MEKCDRLLLVSILLILVSVAVYGDAKDRHESGEDKKVFFNRFPISLQDDTL